MRGNVEDVLFKALIACSRALSDIRREAQAEHFISNKARLQVL